MSKSLQATIERLEALAVLASSNFPRNTDITLQCAGADNSGSVVIKCFELKEIIKLARAAQLPQET